MNEYCKLDRHPSCKGYGWNFVTNMPATCSCDCHAKGAGDE